MKNIFTKRYKETLRTICVFAPVSSVFNCCWWIVCNGQMVHACYAWFTFSSWVLVETFVEMWMRQVRTNVDIHTLVRDSSITRQDIRDILVSSDLGLIYQHVSESFETRWEQVESVEDDTNVPFTLLFSSCLVLSRQECKPGITGVAHAHCYKTW